MDNVLKYVGCYIAVCPFRFNLYHWKNFLSTWGANNVFTYLILLFMLLSILLSHLHKHSLYQLSLINLVVKPIAIRLGKFLLSLKKIAISIKGWPWSYSNFNKLFINMYVTQIKLENIYLLDPTISRGYILIPKASGIFLFFNKLNPKSLLNFIKNKFIFIVNITVFIVWSKILYKYCTNLTNLYMSSYDFFFYLCLYGLLCGTLAVFALVIRNCAFDENKTNYFTVFLISFITSFSLLILTLYIKYAWWDDILMVLPFIQTTTLLCATNYPWPNDPQFNNPEPSGSGLSNPGSSSLVPSGSGLSNPVSSNSGPSGSGSNNPVSSNSGPSDAPRDYEYTGRHVEGILESSPWFDDNTRRRVRSLVHVAVEENSSGFFSTNSAAMYGKLRIVKDWQGSYRALSRQLYQVNRLLRTMDPNSTDVIVAKDRLTEMHKRLRKQRDVEGLIEKMKSQFRDRPFKVTYLRNVTGSEKYLLRKLTREALPDIRLAGIKWGYRSYQSAIPLHYATVRLDNEVVNIRTELRQIYHDSQMRLYNLSNAVNNQQNS